MADAIETTTAECVEAAQAGDQTAYARLVELYQHAVFTQCRRLTSNRADAEDLAHDTFVQAFTQIRQLREPARFAGWLRTIVINRLCAVYLQ
jgi:RNA polymerase sigma-70 factor (ECF subfamily)